MRYMLVLLSVVAIMTFAGQACADVMWGSDIRINAGESSSEAVVIFGDIDVYGSVGDAVSIFGDVRVRPGGTVNGDIVSIIGSTWLGRECGAKGDVVSILGSTNLGPDAHINGDVVSILGPLRLENGATVRGDKVQIGGKEIFKGHSRGSGFGSGFRHNNFDDIWKTIIFGPFIGVLPAFGVFFITLLSLFKLIVWCGIAMLIAWFLPDAVTRLSDCGMKSPLKVLAVGLITTILLPVFLVFFVITILGIPIAVLLIMMTIIGYLVGYIGVAMWLGRRLPNAAQRSPVLNVLLGVLVIGLLGFVPIVGLLIKIAIWFGALGMIVLSRFGTKNCVVS